MTMVCCLIYSFVARFRLWTAELVGLRLQEETVDRCVYDVTDGLERPPTSGVIAVVAESAVH